ncbi:hypothetical protein V6Z12_A05G168500 [Gossypium hirsutum]
MVQLKFLVFDSSVHNLLGGSCNYESKLRSGLKYGTSFHTRPYIIHSSKAPIAVKNISCSAL